MVWMKVFPYRVCRTEGGFRPILSISFYMSWSQLETVEFAPTMVFS